jgi:hypothetical protein
VIKQGQKSKENQMGDSGIQGHKALSSPSKAGAALGVWSDLTVFAVRGGQTVLSLADLGQQDWANADSQGSNLVDPATDILVARKRSKSPPPPDAGPSSAGLSDKKDPASASIADAGNHRNTQPPSEALAILELAFGLGNMQAGDALLDEATLCEPAACDVEALDAQTNSTPDEVPLDPLSDAACALSFDAALKAALAADAAALATELAAAEAAGVPPHGSAQAALLDGSSHPLFSN